MLTWQAVQAVGVGNICVPVREKPVVLWSNAAVVQLTVVWQEEQFAAAKGDPDVEWTGVVRLLPGRQVALRVAAIGRRDRQGIVVVDVAQIAGHVGMPVGQQETGRAVVECRCGPTSRGVACRAIRKRKGRPGRWVHGIRGLLPGCQVASRVPAIVQRGRQIVIVVDMAEGTGHVRVAMGQQESGRAVVELGVQPIVKGMAGRAVRAANGFRPMDAPDSSSAENPSGGRTRTPLKGPGNYRRPGSCGIPGIAKRHARQAMEIG